MTDHDDGRPQPPANLSPGALALWEDSLVLLDVEEQEPTPSELRLLTDAVNSASLVDRLMEEVERDGFTVSAAPRAGTKPNPLLVDVDRARRTTALLLKQIGQTDRATSSRANGASRWRK